MNFERNSLKYKSLKLSSLGKKVVTKSLQIKQQNQEKSKSHFFYSILLLDNQPQMNNEKHTSENANK